MKRQSSYNIKFSIVIMLLFAIIFTSCEKDEVRDISSHYLISYNKVSEYSCNVLISTMYIFSYQYPDLTSIASNSKYDVALYKIVYRTSFLGDSIYASGLVIVPEVGKSLPLISFQNGTNTLQSNAPSIAYDSIEYTMLSGFASTGYVIDIPDYIGFGESQQILHPYHDRQSSDDAVIDMIKATAELLQKRDIPAKSNNKLYLMGYSQGGWATLSALDKIENQGELSMQLISVSCGAGAYNLSLMSDYMFHQTTYPNPFYLPYFIDSHQQLGTLTDSLSLFFNPPFYELIPSLFDGNKTEAEINSQLNDTIEILCSNNLIENFNTAGEFSTLRNELKVNSIEGWNTSVPINFYHSTGDKSVPPSESLYIVTSFLNAGTHPGKVNLIEIDSLDHSEAAIPWGIQTIRWFSGSSR